MYVCVGRIIVFANTLENTDIYVAPRNENKADYSVVKVRFKT